MSPLTTLANPVNLQGEAGIPTTISHSGTSLFVMNTDATAVNNTAGADPWALTRSSGLAMGTNHGNIRPIPVPQMYRYLVMYLAVQPDTSNATTRPVVQVFGRVPQPHPVPNRAWPEDDSWLFRPVGNKSKAAGDERMWVPLAASRAQRDVTAGDPLQHPSSFTIPNQADGARAVYANPPLGSLSSSSSSGQDWFWIGPPSMYVDLSGVDLVIACITTAGVLNNSGTGMIVGRFISA